MNFAGHSPGFSWLLGALLTTAVAGLGAQQPAMPPAGPQLRNLAQASDVRAGCGMHDGRLRAAGGDYKAEFAATGVTVIPAFGPAAPHNFPAVWRTTHIGRRTALVAAAPVAPELVDAAVEYGRGTCIERYAPQPVGLAQSFVFAERPIGEGDLIVRGALTTALVVTPHADGGLQLRAPGIGAYRVTGVQGIAADGTTCRGELRLVDGGLEYVLPAAFVASAALPLVLDPTWGSQVTVETSTAVDRYPDIAVSRNFTRHWLVVWEHVFSATDSDVYGQFFDGFAQLSGGRLLLAATSANERGAAICSLIDDGFVLTYAAGSGVAARTVVSGVVGSAITVAASGSQPAIGSHLATANRRVAIVWDTGPNIDLAIYAVNGATLSLASGPSTVLTGSASAPFNIPAISHSSGLGCDGICPTAVAEQQARWAVVAHRDWSLDSDLYLRVVDYQGAVVGSYTIDSSNEDHDFARVDGNGRDWIVAWQRRVNGERDVLAQQFSLPTGSTTVTAPAAFPTLIAGTIGRVEVYPSVTWLGTSVLIGYLAEQSTGLFLPRMTSRSLLGCEVCAGDLPLPGNLATATASGWITAGSLEAFDPYADEFLAAYSYPNPAHGGNGQILAFQGEYPDGLLTDYAGNCGGASGTVLTSCAIDAPAAFHVHLTSSRPNGVAFLVLSPNTTALWCGGCRLLPDPANGLVLLATTDAVGRATISFPSLNSGALWNRLLYAQWFIQVPSGAACGTYGVDLSSAKRILVQ